MQKQLAILLLVTSLMACQQEDNEPAPFDNLETTGILGRWEITHEVINGGISDMLPRCCEFLAFTPDDNMSDYTGLLSYTDAQGSINSGTFEVDTSQQMILFIDNNNHEFTFKFSVNDAQENLTIDFIEDGMNYTQNWVKIE